MRQRDGLSRNMEPDYNEDFNVDVEEEEDNKQVARRADCSSGNG